MATRLRSVGRKRRIVVTLAVGVFGLAAAHAGAVTITPGANTVAAARIAMDFGPADATQSPERVDSLVWTDSSNVLSANLATQGGGTCGDAQEFFGQSYGSAGGFVVAGSIGTWAAASSDTVQIDTTNASCGAQTPIRTTFRFFDAAPAYNQMVMTRRWDFTSQHPSGDIRAYVPRLPIGTYSETLYPSNGPNPTLKTADPGVCGGGCVVGDWDGTWFALNDPAAKRGLVVLRDTQNQRPAVLVVDNDGFSSSNLSAVDLTAPPGTWTGLVTETEYFCFYDLTSWPQARRDQLLPPVGCGPVPIPQNTSPPTISGDPGGQRAHRRSGDLDGQPDDVHLPVAPLQRAGRQLPGHPRRHGPDLHRRAGRSGLHAAGPRDRHRGGRIEHGRLGADRRQRGRSACDAHAGEPAARRRDRRHDECGAGGQRLEQRRGDAADRLRRPDRRAGRCLHRDSDGCGGQALAPGAACTVGVAFTPASRGAFDAVLAVVDDAPGSPHTVSLSGTGIAPTATVAPAAIDFGDVHAAAERDTRTVTVTNGGPDALTVREIQLTGDGAAAYSLASHCGHVDPGGSCTIDVTFAPGAIARYPATLTLLDDAADSPQQVAITGFGAAAVAGRVSGESGAPLPGVEVTGCTVARTRCVSTRADADGRYGLGLPAGVAQIEAYPNDRELNPASATVVVAADRTITQDLRLRRPVPISDGVRVLTPSGEFTSGVPLVRWDLPFALSVPVDIVPSAKPGATIIYQSVVGIRAASGTADGGGFVLAGATVFSVSYGADGKPDGISPIVTGQFKCGEAGASRCDDLVVDETPTSELPEPRPDPDGEFGPATDSGSPGLLGVRGRGGIVHALRNVVISQPGV